MNTLSYEIKIIPQLSDFIDFFNTIQRRNRQRKVNVPKTILL